MINAYYNYASSVMATKRAAEERAAMGTFQKMFDSQLTAAQMNEKHYFDEMVKVMEVEVRPVLARIAEEEAIAAAKADEYTCGELAKDTIGLVATITLRHTLNVERTPLDSVAQDLSKSTGYSNNQFGRGTCWMK